MLDMGFIHDIKRLMKLMPKSKQTLLFSATFSSEIKTLASSLLTNPVTIEVARENSTAQQISQVVHLVDKGRKKELLSHLIKTHDWQQILVFMRTKHGANRLSKQLIESGITATAIHGNKSQGARTKALADFKARDVKVLVATDIAARGLDISDLPHVVNFELPNIPEDYVHRIGRTGRAGQSGEAVSLVSIDEHGLLKDIERFIKKNVPKVEIESFRPDPSIKAEPAKKKQNSRNNSSDRKRGTSRKKSKESLASEIGSKMMNKLDKYDKPKNTRSRRR
jgi:ATP-dependent RNA helicase RhlE